MREKGFVGVVILFILLLIGVGVGGYLLGTQHHKVVFSPSPSPTPNQVVTSNSLPKADPVPSASPSANLLDTSSWLTRQDPKAGFSFKYPPDWKETIISSYEFEFKKIIDPHTAPEQTAEGVDVSTYTDSGSLTARDFLKQQFYPDEPLLQNYAKTDPIQPVTLGGRPAEEVETLLEPPGAIGWGIWTTNGSYGIFLRFLNASEFSDPKTQTLLSTFRFL